MDDNSESSGPPHAGDSGPPHAGDSGPPQPGVEPGTAEPLAEFDAGREHLKRALEALVLVAEDPTDSRLLAQLLEASPALVDELCRELANEYANDHRGFELVRVAGGWRYQSHPDMAPYVEQFVLAGQSARLSNAALESLAIVAYKQPISRAQVAAIRGVSADGVLRTLTQRGYITEIARDPGPGQASLYGTTPLFLERLGIDSLADLPAVADFVPSADVVETLEQGLRFDDLDDELAGGTMTQPPQTDAGEAPLGTSAESLPGFDVDDS